LHNPDDLLPAFPSHSLEMPELLAYSLHVITSESMKTHLPLKQKRVPSNSRWSKVVLWTISSQTIIGMITDRLAVQNESK